MLWTPTAERHIFPAVELLQTPTDHRTGVMGEISTTVHHAHSRPTPGTREIRMENTSGQGKSAIVPDAIKGWNWGAFLMGFIWGVPNKVYISFVSGIPYIGFAMQVALGIKGSEWAWQNREWESIEHFKRVQRKWTQGSVIFIVVFIALVGALIFNGVIDTGEDDAMDAEDVPSRSVTPPAATQPAPPPAITQAAPPPAPTNPLAAPQPIPPSAPPVSPTASLPPVELRTAAPAGKPPATTALPDTDTQTPAANATAATRRHSFGTANVRECLLQESNSQVAACVERLDPRQ